MPTPHCPDTLGNYPVITPLGRGGMADVFLAMAPGLTGVHKLVVVKRLRVDVVEECDYLAMFFDEARLAARFNHPNIVQTLEVVEGPGLCLLVMEHLDGQPLRALLHAMSNDPSDRTTLGLKLRVLCDVLAGLHHAHELRDFDGSPLNVVHRDISPHNIFVTYDGQVKVLDFGIAKAATCSTRTRTGVLKGKPTYMAPEHVCGLGVDRRADLFSVGVMLWEVITGARPWKGLNDIQILGRLSVGQFPAPRSAYADVDPELERICLRATAADRADRHDTAAQMREDLERYIEQAGLTTTPRALGAVVSELFQRERLQLSSLLDAWMRRAGPTLGSRGFVAAPSTLRGQLRSLPSLADIEPTTTSSSLSCLSNHANLRAALVASVPPAASAGRLKLPSVLLLALGLLGLAGAVLTVASRSAAPAAAPPSLAPEASASPSPAPEASASPGLAPEVSASPASPRPTPEAPGMAASDPAPSPQGGCAAPAGAQASAGHAAAGGACAPAASTLAAVPAAASAASAPKAWLRWGGSKGPGAVAQDDLSLPPPRGIPRYPLDTGDPWEK